MERIVILTGAGISAESGLGTFRDKDGLWTRYDLTSAFSLALGGTYQDSFFVQEDNSVEVPSFTRIDAAAYYQLSDRTMLQLNIENLLDEEYFPDAHSNTNISTGRPLNARVSVVMNF